MSALKMTLVYAPFSLINTLTIALKKSDALHEGALALKSRPMLDMLRS